MNFPNDLSLFICLSDCVLESERGEKHCDRWNEVSSVHLGG